MIEENYLFSKKKAIDWLTSSVSAIVGGFVTSVVHFLKKKKLHCSSSIVSSIAQLKIRSLGKTHIAHQCVKFLISSVKKEKNPSNLFQLVAFRSVKQSCLRCMCMIIPKRDVTSWLFPSAAS